MCSDNTAEVGMAIRRSPFSASWALAAERRGFLVEVSRIADALTTNNR
jgi:hypothetical protein